MINIPEEVKQLFKQNSVSKNFRVSFPNGEYPDLVNKDFVSESVVFTESIGSTDGLKFGLSEGATLEFQTYFNVNIRNLKIYAEIEVDVSTLTDTALNYKESDDVPYPYYPVPYGYFWVDSCLRDGTNNIRKVLAYQNKWDLYGGFSNYIKLSDDEIAKFSTIHTNKSSTATYTAKLEHIPELMCSCLNSTEILGELVEDTEVPLDDTRYSGDSGTKLNLLAMSSSSSISVSIYINYERAEFWDYSLLNSTDVLHPYIFEENYHSHEYMYRLEFDSEGAYATCVHDIFIDYISHSEILNNHYRDKTPEEIYEILKAGDSYFANNPIINALEYVYPHIVYLSQGEQYTSATDAQMARVYNKDNYTYSVGTFKSKISESSDGIQHQSVLFYPELNNFYNISHKSDGIRYFNFAILRIPTSITIVERNTSTSEYIYNRTANIPTISSSIKLYQLSYYSDLINYVGNVTLPVTKSTGKYADYDDEISSSPPTHYRYSARNSLTSLESDISDIIQSFAEIRGGFLKRSRIADSFEFVYITDSETGLYPSEDVYPEEHLYPRSENFAIPRYLWRTLWYDDKKTNGYDRLCCNYATSSNATEYKEILLVDTADASYNSRDYQRYDISDNYFVKTYGALPEELFEDYFEHLAYILSETQYYKSEIEMRALPYIEPGDILVVITKDGGFTTYCLRHRISGIQSLTDNIESR